MPEENTFSPNFQNQTENQSQVSHQNDSLNNFVPQPSFFKFNSSQFWLILAFIAVAIILVIAGLWWWQNRQTVNLFSAGDEQLEFASENINWMKTSVDSRGLYTDINTCNYDANSDSWSCSVGAPSNRAFLPVIWAEYQYYLTTGDEKVLNQLKTDIATVQSVIFDSELYEIQNNYYNCLFMADILTDKKAVFTEKEKNTLQAICLNSTNEVFDQNNLLSLADDALLDENLIRNNITDLTTSINQKVALINSGAIDSYQIANDNFFSERAPDEWVRLAVPQYYYFAQDDFARYNLSGKTTDLSMALTMLDDVLSLYIAQKQGVIEESFAMADCLLDAIYQEAQYYGGLGLTPLELNFKFSADEIYSPGCYVAQLHRAESNDLDLDTVKKIISKNSIYSSTVSGDPMFFASFPLTETNGLVVGNLVENGSLVGILSK